MNTSTLVKLRHPSSTSATCVQKHDAFCRLCHAPLQHLFVDLGMSPLCESYLGPAHLNQMESFYPLRVYVCEHCFLVQLEEYVSPNAIFGDYAYFSSYSDTWLQHAKDYVAMIAERLELTSEHQVVEIASNDGYLLQYFVEKQIPALGIEPAANVAEVARHKKIPTLVQFFGEETAQQLVRQGTTADLIVGNNVLAQVPDLLDFVRGLKVLLKPHGVITMEFPHLERLMENNQLDTIYHEHFSYFSLRAVNELFALNGLTLFDVEKLATHGGSLRIYARHCKDGTHPIQDRLMAMKQREEVAGFGRLEHYLSFSEQAKNTKRELLQFLISAKQKGHTIVGYGAPGKGNTLLNYCGIRDDFIDYTVDRSPYKQGKFLPGTHIPIFHPDKIRTTQPDYLLILPWNLKDEIMRQVSFIRDWGGRFVVPIPRVTVYA